MAAGHARAPMVITHAGGMKFAAQIRGHTLIVDQPARAGGEDSGPMPIELLGASLGTCVALYVQQFLQSRGLPHEGMSVEVQTQGAASPNRIGQFSVDVKVPADLPPHEQEMLERVAASCPAHHTLHLGAIVDIRVAAGATVAQAG